MTSKSLEAPYMKLDAQKKWRRRRLAELMDELGQTNLSRMTGIDGAYLFQMAKGTGKSARNVTDQRVETIEDRTGRYGWFDFRPNGDPLMLKEQGASYVDAPGGVLSNTRSSKVINLAQLDVRASMGTGIDLQEHVEVVRMIQVNLPDLRRVLPSFTAPENLVIITGLGDSMRGTFNDGDPIIVDQGVKEVTVEGIYVLRRDSELFIKRLQRQLDGTLMMLSDNPRYPPQHITDDTRKAFDVVGRALGVWNFQKF